MANCNDYISADDLKTGKQAILHIEHVAKSRDAAGNPALSVTDPIRGESVTNKTLDGLEELYTQAISQVGYILIDSFQSGNTLSLPNQVLRDTDTGEYYRWDGAFPKIVPPGSTPASTGGIGVGAWVSVGDASLRYALLQPNGASMIGTHANVTVQQIIDGVDSFAILRTLVPSVAGTKIKLKGYYSGSIIGGGEFIARSGTATDDSGVIAVVNSSWYWERVLTDRIWPEMFGAKNDGVTYDAVALNKCLLAASSYGKKVTAFKKGTFLCDAPISVPGGVKVYGRGKMAIKRAPSVNTSLDFITLGAGSLLDGVEVDGSRDQTQAPAEVVLIRIGNNAHVTNCNIHGSVGYLIVANVTTGVRISKNKLYDSAGYAVALFGDGSGSSADAIVYENTITDFGAGAVAIQQYNHSLIRRNKCTGVIVGGPGDRMYVSTNVNGAVTAISGPTFAAAKPGMWVVLPGGSEHRIIAVSSVSNITVSPAPPSTSSNIRAIFGSGDIIGVQSCSFVDVDDNYISDTVTYGTGGGTTAGNSYQLNYCRWINNTVRNTGKNGINLGQAGASCASNVVDNNQLILCGNGGIGTSNAYLLPAFDTAGIALHQTNPGLLVNTKITNNEVITYGADLGVGDSWLSMSGLSQGSVIAFGNSQTGYVDGYVRGDILDITLTGYGTGSAVTNNVSTGDRVVVSIQTGTSPTASPYFVVNKVIRSPTEPVLMAQVATTNGTVAFCWGLQSSTTSSWAVGQNATPSGNITYHIRG